MATRGKDVNEIVKETVAICGLDCPDCALKVEKAIQKMPGVKDAAVNFAAGNLHVEYDPSVNTKDTIFSKVEDLGYEVGTDKNRRHSVFRVQGLD